MGLALAASWIGIYGLYSAYTWTVRLSPSPDSTVQVVRFYLPALGAVTLLAAWLLTELPRWLPVAALAVLATLAAVAYPNLAGGHLAGLGGGIRPPIGTPPNGQMPAGFPPAAGGPGAPPPGG